MFRRKFRRSAVQQLAALRLHVAELAATLEAEVQRSELLALGISPDPDPLLAECDCDWDRAFVTYFGDQP